MAHSRHDFSGQDNVTEPMPAASGCDFSRREFISRTAAAAVGLGIRNSGGKSAVEARAMKQKSSNAAEITLRVNGRDHRFVCEPRVTLLDALRERARLTGPKKGCDRGECGACTVHVNGRSINACMTLAIMQQGKEIVTIEGLGSEHQLHPVQAAFIEHDAFQCGYCTPGQIMSAVACIRGGHANTDDEIREWMSGNICRCSAYANIVAAIKEVARGSQL